MATRIYNWITIEIKDMYIIAEVYILCLPPLVGATEDAINAAREAFHAQVASQQKKQQQSHDTSEEDLSLLDEKELDAEFAGEYTKRVISCFIFACNIR